MTLLPFLLLQLENPHLSRNQRAELSCQVAQELEDVGDYKGAAEALREFWRRVGDRPRVGGLNQSTAAELLLRAGTLTGWIGHSRSIKGAQETAKNLITESIRIFESLRYTKKLLEAHTELAYCYWREGSYDEARIVLHEVIDKLTVDSELKAKAVLRSVIVECAATRFSDALGILTNYAPLFDKINNHTVKGGYHNELAIVLRNLGTAENREDYTDRAIIEYTAASYHFEQAGHNCYRANVENNLGFLYFTAGKFEEAHEHLDRSRRLLVTLNDSGTIAQVDETRARVFLAERRHVEAEKAARAAVMTLERGGRQSLLAEALTTHAKALARLVRHDKARLVFHRAIEVSHSTGALNDAGLAALTLLEELSEHLSAEEIKTAYKRGYEWLFSSQDEEILRRLLSVSARIVNSGSVGNEHEIETRGTLKQVMRSYEAKLIKQALHRAGGIVTQAARLLGMTHQTLIYLLNHRHTNLLAERTPAIRRRRSVVKRERKS